LLIQYLLTAHGERVNRPDFGTALPRMCFEGNSHGIAEVIQFAARAGVQRWLGDAIQVLELSVTAQEATLAVDLSYRLRGEDEIRVARQTLALAPGAVL
jgi:phage baseplate assembly protein W